MVENPLEFSTIKVILRQVSTDPTDTLILQLIENIQRTDLTPLEEAETYARIKEAKSLNNKELALLVSKSESRVSRILKLLKLSEEDKIKIGTGELSARDVQREKGTEAASKASAPNTDKSKPRESKLSISMNAAESVAELLKYLAETNELSGIDLGSKNKKDLIAIIESRAAEIFGAVKK